MRAFLTILLLGAIPCSASAAVYLSGQVLQKGSHLGVPGATISLFPALGTGLPLEQPIVAVQALGNGSYLLKIPTAGKYRLTLSALNYLPQQTVVDIPPAGLPNYTLILEKLAMLALKLQPPDGTPLKQALAYVTIWTSVGTLGHMDTSLGSVSKDGLVEIPIPASLTTRQVTGMLIEVTSPGLGIGTVRLPRWPTAPTPVSLQTGSSISGTVRNADGKPAPGAVAAIRMLDADIPLMGNGVPDMIEARQGGHFTISALLPGRYLVMAFNPAAGLAGPGEVDLKTVDLPADSEPIVLTLASSKVFQLLQKLRNIQPGGLPSVPALRQANPAVAERLPGFTGRILDSGTGNPVQGAMLSLAEVPVGVAAVAPPITDLKFNPAGTIDVANSSRDGAYRLQAPAGKKYVIRVDDPRYYPIERAVEVPAEGNASAPFNLVRVPTVVARLIGPDGNVIAHASTQTMIVDRGRTDPPSFGGMTDVGPETGLDGTIEMTAPRMNLGPQGGAGVIIGVRVNKHGYGLVRFEKWPTGPIEIHLDKASMLSGSIKDSLGKPVVRTAVIVTGVPPKGDAIPAVTLVMGSDPDGKFEVGSIPPGHYRVQIIGSAEQFTPAEVEVAGPRTEVTFTGAKVQDAVPVKPQAGPVVPPKPGAAPGRP